MESTADQRDQRITHCLCGKRHPCPDHGRWAPLNTHSSCPDTTTQPKETAR